MDVQADEARLRPDPFDTGVVERVERPVTDSQGQLFADASSTYANTDKIPAVGRGRDRGIPSPRPSRWLRVLVVLVALVVVAAGATLGLVKAGVIDKSGTNNPSPTNTTQHHAAAASKAPLVTPVSTGNGTATYKVDIAAYAVTVVTTTGRSWVSIGATGQHPAFAGILNPNSSQKELLLGPATIDVGAGGTKVIVTSNQRTQTLTPASAPFSYSFVIKS
jgi:hypothetical protein